MSRVVSARLLKIVGIENLRHNRGCRSDLIAEPHEGLPFQGVWKPDQFSNLHASEQPSFYHLKTPTINGNKMNDSIDSANSKEDRVLTVEEKKSAKIFLIDDEPLILEIFECYLSEAGFQSVYAFSDSVEAFETLRYVTPSIILTDIHMPEVSGNFLIKLIRTYEHLKTVPIVAITSDTAVNARENVLRKGADTVMHKPVDATALTSCVSKVLSSTLKLKSQLSAAENREQQDSEVKKAKLMSSESNLRNLMR